MKELIRISIYLMMVLGLATGVPSSITTPTLIFAPVSVQTDVFVPVDTTTSAPKPIGTAMSKSAVISFEKLRTVMTWATWTATTMGVATGTATYTAGVRSLPISHLLDRLARNKPYILGNKGFYILLGVLYLTLLGLFLKQIVTLFKRQP